MISKATIAATIILAAGFASQAFAQAPRGDYEGYANSYVYPDGQQPPYSWEGYGYGTWPSAGPASIDNNIHTPPNH